MMTDGLQSIWRRVSLTDVTGLNRPRTGDVTVVFPDGNPPPWKPDTGRQREKPRKAHHLGGPWIQASYALIDLFLICVDGCIALFARFLSDSPKITLHWHKVSGENSLPITHYVAILMLYAVLILLFCQSQELYRTVRTRTAADESMAVIKALFCATLFLSAFLYLSGTTIVSRLFIGYASVLNVLTFISWRLWKRRIILRRAARGIGTRNVLIVGAGRIGQALAAHLEENTLLGYSFKGFLDANHSTHPRLLGKIEDLSRIAKAQFVDEVFISIPSERELVKNIAAEARLNRLTVKVVPDLYDGVGWNAPINHIGQFPVMELHGEPIPIVGLFFKRVIDVAGSTLGLAVLSPLLAAVMICIWLDSPGPAIYSSPRVGRKGRKFVCYKFRTMMENADAVKHQLRHLNEREGPTFKIANDPRITRIGKFLRKYSLDELPQLWNVLKGEMSLVGPRPHPLDDYEQYQLEHLRRLDVKPGITGLWQVMARQDPSFDANMELDLQYIDHWRLFLDMKILIRTVTAVLSGSGG